MGTSNSHSHAPEPRELARKKAMDQFKENVVSSTESRRAVVQDFCSQVDVELSSVLPSVNSLMSNVNRTRKADNISEIGKDPKCLTELLLNEDDIKTKSGEPFLIYDHHKIIAKQRIIIFASSKALEFLSKATVWYMDGTFQAAPRLFYQLYTIHGESIHRR